MGSLSLNHYRDVTMSLCHHKGWASQDIQNVWMLFTEEIGELAGAIRQYRGPYKKKTMQNKVPIVHLRNEFGDVFSYLFQLAGMLNIDLDKMWYYHQHNMVYKHYPDENISLPLVSNNGLCPD
jgi:NTP pyrophosphatase (non-canonical NTP hydrolase)